MNGLFRFESFHGWPKVVWSERKADWHNNQHTLRAFSVYIGMKFDTNMCIKLIKTKHW